LESSFKDLVSQARDHGKKYEKHDYIQRQWVIRSFRQKKFSALQPRSFFVWTLFFSPGPAFSGASFGYSTSFTPTGHSMGSSAVPSDSRNASSIRELLFSAGEESLVAGENHLPQLREFQNVRVVRFLCDARLKFKRLSH
jgi:hypothetical protein